jgi:hypothetical protein
MKLRFFVLDPQGRLCRVSQSVIKRLCRGHADSVALGCPGARELRLVSAICDDELQPQKLFLVRLPLTQGRFTYENYLVLQAWSRPDCVTAAEAFGHHTEGWPADFFPQIAVALDVPVTALNVPLGIGGPLWSLARDVGLRPLPRHLR